MAIEKKPVTRKVYDFVYDSIVNGQFTCNDLLTESNLATQLNVSKAPVREALLMLCQQNILQALPRVGYRVVQISPVQVNKLVETRMLLELYMLEKGWPTIGEAQIEHLLNVYRSQQKAESQKEAVLNRWRCNIEFHLALAGFCDNEYLLSALEDTLNTCARAATQCFLGYREARKEAKYHEDILAALEAHDYAAAKAALIGDIHELL